MVEHVGSASSILIRLLDTAATQPSLVPSLVQLMQVPCPCDGDDCGGFDRLND
jgi:hypothetical protein